MNIVELDGKIFSDETFAEKVVIRGCHNLTFNDCKFPAGLVVHVDRDSSNLAFHRTQASKMQVGYFGDMGVLDGLLIDTAKAEQFQVFLATDTNIFERRTKNLVWRNLETYDTPNASYLPALADNPIIENCVSVGAHGAGTNAFQINNCISPVLRGNTAGRTVSTNPPGDGCGIIIDWFKKDETKPCFDALVENNLCFGNFKGISNWKGAGSVIRKNRLVDNQIGLKFNQYNDYHAYGNDLLNNETDVKFTNGATDVGYANNSLHNNPCNVTFG